MKSVAVSIPEIKESKSTEPTDKKIGKVGHTEASKKETKTVSPKKSVKEDKPEDTNSDDESGYDIDKEETKTESPKKSVKEDKPEDEKEDKDKKGKEDKDDKDDNKEEEKDEEMKKPGFITGTALLAESPKKSLSYTFTKTDTAATGKAYKGLDLDIASSTSTSPTRMDYLLNNTPRKRMGLSRSAKTPSLHKFNAS